MRKLAPCLLLVVAFAPAADLRITDVQFRPAEAAPPLSTPIYSGGVPLFLSFRVTGFASTHEDKDVHLTYNIRTTDPSSRPLAEAEKGEVKVQLAPEDKEWGPKIRYEVQIPPVPEPGTYTVHISLEDMIGHRTATENPTFTVQSQNIPDLSKLGVSNFAFKHSANDVTRIQTGAVYKPGAVVWAAFDMAGYKFGPNNKFSITYGFSLAAPDGKVVFEQPKAASDSDESFYPKLYRDATMSLKLAEHAPPGKYTLTIRVHDEIGDQTAESPHTFQVEN